MNRHRLSPSSPGSTDDWEPVSKSHPLHRQGLSRAKTLCAATTAIIIAALSVAVLNPWTPTRAESSEDAKVQAEKAELQKREVQAARQAKAREERAREKDSKERAVLSASSNAAVAGPQFSLQPATQPSTVNYLAAHYNSQRTGWNPNETLLTPTNVSTNNTVTGAHNFNTHTAGFFGELWNSPQLLSPTNGVPNIYATPLYVDSVTMGSSLPLEPIAQNQTLSVTYCATSQCDLYAVLAAGTVIGATGVPPGTILWHTNVGTPNFGTDGVNVGIFGTPIINLNATPPTMYVTASFGSSTFTGNPTGWVAFAVDITNGNVLWDVPINDTTVQSAGVQNGPATFSSGGNSACRGAANLSADGSILYVPISDYGKCAGFMIAIATTGTPRIVSSFAGTPGGSVTGNNFAGMWGAAGASLDAAGNIYVCTGDDPNVTEGDNPSGPATEMTSGQDNTPGYWGMSMLVFNPLSTLSNPAVTTLSLRGTYSPWNYQSMDYNDVDIASTPVVIPTLGGAYPHCVVFGAKNGNLYLVNYDTLPGGTVQRPLAANGTNYRSDFDETSFVGPAQPYYTNPFPAPSGTPQTPDGASGPLNVFGPYSEGTTAAQSGLQATTFAKARTSPCIFQGPDNNYYVVYTGQSKYVNNGGDINNGGQQTNQAIPPGIARVKINTSSGTPYLSLTPNVAGSTDYYDMLDSIQNAGSAIVSSNGNSNSIAWMLDENASRSASLPGTHPYLLGLDAMTMTPLYMSAFDTINSGRPSTLHAGGKYNEPSVARGKVFVGTDRLQVFGVTSYVYAIGAGGPGGAGTQTSTMSPQFPVLPNGTLTRSTITTTVGKTFTTDAFFTGGTTFTPGVLPTIDVTTVSNPAPQAVYQNARVGVNNSSGFTYTFPNLTPGATYSVRLHFAEINTSVTRTGRRKFNVSINGNQVLTNYDIFSVTGGANVACEEAFGAVADPTAGTITIAFASTGTNFPPAVNGIEINAIPDSIGQEYWFDWLAQYGLLGPAASPTADAMNDGVPNVWKYFTNADPTAHGNPSTLLPQVSKVTSGGTTYLQFSILERIDYSTRGFSFAIQTSPSLSPATWTTVQSYNVVSTTPTGDGVTQTVVLQTPIAPNTKSLFAHVLLTLANN